MKYPSGEVLADREIPIPRWVSLMVTPGSTAPVSSRTTPSMSPVVMWDWAKQRKLEENNGADEPYELHEVLLSIQWVDGDESGPQMAAISIFGSWYPVRWCARLPSHS